MSRTFLAVAISLNCLAALRVSAQTPVIDPGGVVNAASNAPGLTPGSLASVYGLNFGSSRSGVIVQLNGITAPLISVSSTQINFQVPWELAGQSQATVSVSVGAAGSNAVTAVVVSFGPGVFLISSAAQGAVEIAGTSMIAAAQGDFPGSRPAAAGEFISIFATGLGPVANQPADGAPATDASSTTMSPVTVTIGGMQARVTFSGLAPGLIGVYQINVQVPSNATSGIIQPVVVTIGTAVSNAVAIAVGTPLAPVYVSSCQTIRGPGTYVLTSDLSSSGEGCLVIAGADVQLDCAGHIVTVQSDVFTTAVTVSNVSGFGMRNCTITDNPTVNGAPQYPTSKDIFNSGLEIYGSTNAFVAGSNIQFVFVFGSNNCWFESNHITGNFDGFQSRNIVVQGNIIDSPGPLEGSMIGFGSGSGNQILNNAIDGGWDHQSDEIGADDGISLDGEPEAGTVPETGDVVQGNSIHNVFDAGIEMVSAVESSLIADNIIQYAGANGIASYYGTTWFQNVIQNNQVFDSPTCIFIEYIGTRVLNDGTIINEGPSDEYEFHDNSFVGNTFRSPTSIKVSIASSSAPLSIQVLFPANLPSDVGNNLIKGNDLGAGSPAPILAPPYGFVDGGGNICSGQGGASPVTCDIQ